MEEETTTVAEPDTAGIEERLDLMYEKYLEVLEFQAKESEYYHTTLKEFDDKLAVISEGCVDSNKLISDTLVSELSFVPLLGIIAGLIFIDIFWRK